MAAQITTSSTFEGKTSGDYTTTIYVESVTEETLPGPRAIPIVEELVLPSTTGTKNADRALNAFLTSRDTPEVWIDSEGGEVFKAEIFDCDVVAVQIAPSVGGLPPSPVAPDETALALYNLTGGTVVLNDITGRISDSSVTNNPYLGLATHVYRKREYTVPVTGGTPKRFKVPAGTKPLIQYSQLDDTNDGNHTGLTVRKYWGQLISDSYTEREVQDLNASTRDITWKKVFQTFGKVIKVVAKVSEVVIPFLLTVLKNPPDLLHLNENRLALAISGGRRGKSVNVNKRKRKAPKRLESSKSKNRKV